MIEDNYNTKKEKYDIMSKNLPIFIDIKKRR